MSDTDYEHRLVMALDEALPRRSTRMILSDHATIGGDGVYGMHLVANCLWQAYEAAEVVLPVDPPRPPPTGPLARELASVKKRLARILKHAEASVVVCYHLVDTGEWNLAFSSDLTLDDAWVMLTGFVKCGMDFEHVV